MRLVQQCQTLFGDFAERARLIDTGNFRPGGVQLAGHQRQQWAGTRNHRAAQRFDDTALDLQLQATEQLNAGQGPAWKRDVALVASRRQHQVRVVDFVQRFFTVKHHQALLITADYPVIQAQVDAVSAGGEFLMQGFQRFAVARAQIAQINAFAQWPAVHNPAWPRGLIEQQTGHAVTRQFDSSGHACRTATHNHRTQTHSASCSVIRLLRVSTCIPG
ncbi:hypothetical protein D3C79_810490 [compost metagenome]